MAKPLPRRGSSSPGGAARVPRRAPSRPAWRERRPHGEAPTRTPAWVEAEQRMGGGAGAASDVDAWP